MSLTVDAIEPLSVCPLSLKLESMHLAETDRQEILALAFPHPRPEHSLGF